jgi:hypothetical protein
MAPVGFVHLGMTIGMTPSGNIGFGIGRFIVDRIAADNFGN